MWVFLLSAKHLFLAGVAQAYLDGCFLEAAARRWAKENCRLVASAPSNQTLSPAVDAAGLSANLLGVAHNLSDGPCWPASPPFPPYDAPC
jgi:hypothetical protein